MPRPLTRAAALENRAFLKLLRKTGNVRLTCTELGLKYGTMQHRKRMHPAFALKWDAALVFAQARFSERQSPKAKRDSRVRGNDQKVGFRTTGGEMTICPRNDGKLQMRRAQPGKLTREGEQAFLAALSVTCNVRLAAAAVGAAFNAFNRRRRKDPAFEREMRLALQRGYEALEMALLESTLPASHEHGDWRSNDPPAIPPMSASQALQLMYLHQKSALLLDEPTPMGRRKGESREARNERLTLMAEARDQRAREAFAIAEAERMERGLPAWGPAGEAIRLGLDPAALLPDLAQVTGWSNADPDKEAHDPDRALFGGWRLAQMERRLEDWELEFDRPERMRGPPRVPPQPRQVGGDDLRDHRDRRTCRTWRPLFDRYDSSAAAPATGPLGTFPNKLLREQKKNKLVHFGGKERWMVGRKGRSVAANCGPRLGGKLRPLTQ